MIDIPTLDSQIRSLEDWIVRAGKSLRGFYHSKQGVFWRDSFGVESKDTRIHPTATNRSFFALYEYRRFLKEEDSKDDSHDEVENVLAGVVEKYLGLLPHSPDLVRKSSSNSINMFTDSHLLMAVSLLDRLSEVIELKVEVPRIRKFARQIATQNTKMLRKWKGGKIRQVDEIHDFVTLHTVRGLDAFAGLSVQRTPALYEELRDRAKEDVLRLLAYHFAGISSKFDPAELVFSISLLNRFPPPDARELTYRSIQSIVESQAPDGAWPTARVISYEGHGLLHVASFEVALTLTNLLLRGLHKDEATYCEMILKTLERAFSLVKSSYNVVGNLSGWANDHTRRTGLIESWSTAIVLTFLIHYRDALLNFRQSILLKNYRPKLPRSGEPITWPDLIPAFRNVHQTNLGCLGMSDPTDNAVLTGSLKSKLLEPIIKDWVQRPQRSSLILYGDPGTRKTTLAIEMGEALRWPLLILSPPDFLRKAGLEGVEASAAEIFDDLFRLRRVIVLFDECEDFFKKREDEDQHLESRTIGAFITSGMLPRLQSLHDKRWAIFLLATNIELEKLDPAVTRPGRFDYAQEISYPTLNAQIRYVSNKVAHNSRYRKLAIRVLTAFAKTVGKKKGPVGSPVAFSHIDMLIEAIVEWDGILSVTKGKGFIESLITRKGPASLTDF